MQFCPHLPLLMKTREGLLARKGNGKEEKRRKMREERKGENLRKREERKGIIRKELKVRKEEREEGKGDHARGHGWSP